MMRRVTAALILFGIAMGSSPLPGCASPASSTMAIQETGAGMAGGCHQHAAPSPCATGSCPALLQHKSLLGERPTAELPVGTTAISIDHTPLPPEPPPPQA